MSTVSAIQGLRFLSRWDQNVHTKLSCLVLYQMYIFSAIWIRVYVGAVVNTTKDDKNDDNFSMKIYITKYDLLSHLHLNRAKLFGAMFQNNILLWNYLTGSHIAFQLSRRPLVNACFLVVPFVVLSFIGFLPFCLPVESGGKVCGKEHCFYIALLNNHHRNNPPSWHWEELSRQTTSWSYRRWKHDITFIACIWWWWMTTTRIPRFFVILIGGACDHISVGLNGAPNHVVWYHAGVRLSDAIHW